mmetsp:Transcript_16146/g.36328  ORF Transcript_16146/g.36328 Transcript_16146/m.36328 type:complete len:201 (+) Transcript_16146:710-1312(+)
MPLHPRKSRLVREIIPDRVDGSPTRFLHLVRLSLCNMPRFPTSSGNVESPTHLDKPNSSKTERSPIVDGSDLNSLHSRQFSSRSVLPNLPMLSGRALRNLHLLRSSSVREGKSHISSGNFLRALQPDVVAAPKEMRVKEEHSEMVAGMTESEAQSPRSNSTRFDKDPIELGSEAREVQRRRSRRRRDEIDPKDFGRDRRE